MGKVRVAGCPELFSMSLHGVDIGPVQKAFVRVGMIGSDALDELCLAHQLASAARAYRRRRRCLRRALNFLSRGGRRAHGAYYIISARVSERAGRLCALFLVL